MFECKEAIELVAIRLREYAADNSTQFFGIILFEISARERASRNGKNYENSQKKIMKIHKKYKIHRLFYVFDISVLVLERNRMRSLHIAGCTFVVSWLPWS